MSRQLPGPAAPPLAPPPGSTPPQPPSGEFGPQIPGLAAPPQPPPPSAMQDIADFVDIKNRLKNIVERHPQAMSVVNQINDGLQQLQMVIVQASAPSQVPAPPV